ncbi:MAG: hypothetical protein WC797_00010 [Candidatus Paceibacterota bacterium]|jgi:hypothetical protein
MKSFFIGDQHRLILIDKASIIHFKNLTEETLRVSFNIVAAKRKKKEGGGAMAKNFDNNNDGKVGIPGRSSNICMGLASKPKGDTADTEVEVKNGSSIVLKGSSSIRSIHTPNQQIADILRNARSKINR